MWVPIFIDGGMTVEADLISVGKSDLFSLMQITPAMDFNHNLVCFVPHHLQAPLLDGSNVLSTSKDKTQWPKIDPSALNTNVALYQSRLDSPYKRITQRTYIGPILLNEYMSHSKERGQSQKSLDDMDRVIKKNWESLVKNKLQVRIGS